MRDTETTLPELKERIARDRCIPCRACRKRNLPGGELQPVELKFGANAKTLRGESYALVFLLPNFLFHVTTRARDPAPRRCEGRQARLSRQFCGQCARHRGLPRNYMCRRMNAPAWSSARRPASRCAFPQWPSMDHVRPHFQCDVHVRAPAAAAKRVASSSSVSCEPTWISVGGKPCRSANSGEMEGSLRADVRLARRHRRVR